MRRRKQTDFNPEINMTNMIDVIFSILVVFMITTPLMNQGVKVDLPKAQAKSMDQEKYISITITKDREILINDEIATSSQSFRKDFREVWKGDPETVVVVNSDRKVPYGIVVKLVADAQAEGAVRLGFLTDPTHSRRRGRH